jgi:CRISPR-associated protein Cas1
LVIKNVDNNKEVIDKIPWKSISNINIIGRSYFSNGVIYRALYNKIPVNIINIQGKYIGSIISDFYKINEVQEHQKEFLKQEKSILEFSREIISAKLNNSYVLLKRNGIDDYQLKLAREKAKNAENIEQLRGIEGAGAKAFFGHLKSLVEPFEFNGRNYYPPTDEVNALLSFAYTLIYNRTASMLIKKGFNPYIGFFHKRRGEHFALASDLMEELRHIGDRLVISLIHKREIGLQHFKKKEEKGKVFVYLNDSGYPIFIRRFEEIFKTKSSYSGNLLSLYEYLDSVGEKVKRMIKLNVPYKALRIR